MRAKIEQLSPGKFVFGSQVVPFQSSKSYRPTCSVGSLPLATLELLRRSRSLAADLKLKVNPRRSLCVADAFGAQRASGLDYDSVSGRLECWFDEK